MIRYLLPMLLFISPCAISAAENEPKNFDPYLNILPRPQKVELLKGNTFLYSSLLAVRLEGLTANPAKDSLLLALPLTTKNEKGTLTLTLNQNINNLPSQEGYILKVANGRITLSAKHEQGLFYGCQTLLQLLEDSKDLNTGIPSCLITDYPDLTYRAVHVDLKHHLDSLSYFYSMIDRLARVKINAIILEFEDKIAYQSASAVASAEAMSIETYARLCRYAHERYIEISPLVQGLGHASFILKHEAYADLRDNPTIDEAFDPLNPKTYYLQFSMYEDAIRATPGGKYLHIGGDEVASLGFSDLAKKSGKTSFELQMHWLKKVCDFAHAHQRIPIFWDDMVLALAHLYATTYDDNLTAASIEDSWKRQQLLLDQNLHLFPKDCIYMRWNYDNPTNEGNRKAIDWYVSRNLQVMAATAGQTKWAMMPRRNSNFQPIKDFAHIASDKKLNGILLTLWDDSSPHFETYWRGIYDFAFFSWNGNNAEAEETHALFRRRFYGPALEPAIFNFQDSLEKTLEFWEKALIVSGRRNNYPDEIRLIPLPSDHDIGAWGIVNSERIAEAKKTMRAYESTAAILERALSINKRNAFSLRLFNEYNRLLAYPSTLLLLLDSLDRTASATERKKIKQGIREYVVSFQQIRTQFEKVFAETRQLYKPCGQIIDQSPHLANGTLNTDWMYVYELAMNRRILNWLSD